MNESFADFSEMLWAEHKYGKDAGSDVNYNAMQTYVGQPDNATKDLVRFHYDDVGDMFDIVTYQKGGRILNMLRNYLGADAFYKGLNIYLKTNAFKNGEAQQLRLAEEEASGIDLNWFFNQWYYGAGHPILDISYKWDEASKTEAVYLTQKQDGHIFKLPMAIDIYSGGKKERRKVWVNDKNDTLNFRVDVKPDLVNVDGDKILLVQKTDNKNLDEYVFQYFNAPLYVDRYEAIEAAKVKQSEKGAQKILLGALHDKYFRLRLRTVRALDMGNEDLRKAALPILNSLAQSDPNTLVRAAAIKALGNLKATGNMTLFRKSLYSQSYAVQGAALTSISQLAPEQALILAKGFEKDNKGPLTQAIIAIYAANGGDEYWPFVFKTFNGLGTLAQLNIIQNFSDMAAHVNNSEYAQQGIIALKDLAINNKALGVGTFVDDLLSDIKSHRVKLNDNASVKAVDNAIQQINNAK